MKDRNIFKHIIIALCIYSAEITVSASFRQSFLIIIITLLLLNIAIRWLSNSKNNRIPFDNNTQNFIYILFILWQSLVVIRGLANFETTDSLFFNIFLNPYSFLAYTIPLFLLLGYRNFDFKYLVKASTVMNIVFVLCVILFYDDIFTIEYTLTADEDTGYGVIARLTSRIVSLYRITSFILLIPFFVEKKIWRLNFICWCIALIIIMIGARRSTIFSLTLTGIAALYFYAKYQKTGLWKRVILIIVFLGGSFAFISNYMGSTFALLEERAMENTRKSVEEYMIKDVFENTDDWIWGRGMGGTYISPLYPERTSPPRRSSMETGYLYIILQGGVISLILYLMLLVPAAIKGWFRSKNLLTKAFAAYIFISILELYPFGIPAFSMHFLMIWIGVAMCSSKYMRNLTNEQIKQLLFNKA